MPTYEYKCPAGHMFEKFYPTMNDQRRVRCPTCGKPAERQISGGAGLVFKGSGFYATDYPRAGEKKVKEKEKEKEKVGDEAKPAPDSTSADSSKPSADSSKKKKDSGHK